VKQFTLRFDVDTHRCAERGVPALLALAAEYKIPFTFFINPGKAVNRLDFIRDLRQSINNEHSAKSLSAFRKLGLKDYLGVSLLNPKISNYAPSLQQIDLSQHEVGLHGGSNHQNWARHASNWSIQKLGEEIIWGKNELKRIFPELRLSGFASPGFTSPRPLDKILHQQGFTYSADINTSNIQDFQNWPSRKIKYPLTSLFGSPAGIATVEYFTALGMSRSEIVTAIIKQIDQGDDSLVIYDHPYFAGIEALNIYRDLLEQIMSRGIQIVTMKDQAIAP
jgi:peptidoglycan/xylan/chitin deacetylase (PgdA/CDA1 family)